MLAIAWIALIESDTNRNLEGGRYFIFWRQSRMAMISEEKTVLTSLRRNEQMLLPILYAQLVEMSDFEPSVKQRTQS